MKNLFLLPLIVLFSCTSGTQEVPQAEKDGGYITSDVNKGDSPKLEIIGHYNLDGGELHVYVFEGDTIYWGQGRSKSYPVSLVVK
jgi:hypothetical protein